MKQPLILVANPGSASRKYALYEGSAIRAKLHFEWINDHIHCTLSSLKETYPITVELASLDEAPPRIVQLLGDHAFLSEHEAIDMIGLRIVAPGSYFLADHEADAHFTSRLAETKEHAPIHVTASLNELDALRQAFPDIPIYGISDSAFHHSKPDYAWNYGISLELADHHDIKRFGYHGLSVASAVEQAQLPEKTIVCHLGSGNSVTALQDGRSIDTTMGYSPLEGLIMGTRSGSLDIGAAHAIKRILHHDELALEKYLNEESGLLGLGGSADIRVLLQREEAGDNRAHLALETYIYSVQKGIAQMAAALQGADSVVFTGTVGERSAPIRGRITQGLFYLGFAINEIANEETTTPSTPAFIHNPSVSKPIIVASTQEEHVIAQRTAAAASQQTAEQ